MASHRLPADGRSGAPARAGRRSPRRVPPVLNWAGAVALCGALTVGTLGEVRQQHVEDRGHAVAVAGERAATDRRAHLVAQRVRAEHAVTERLTGTAVRFAAVRRAEALAVAREAVRAAEAVVVSTGPEAPPTLAPLGQAAAELVALIDATPDAPVAGRADTRARADRTGIRSDAPTARPEHAAQPAPAPAPDGGEAVRPATTGTDPATASTDPATAGTDPATAGTDPATAGTDPATAGTDPATAGTDPATPDAHATLPGTDATAPAGRGTATVDGDSPAPIADSAATPSSTVAPAAAPTATPSAPVDSPAPAPATAGPAAPAPAAGTPASSPLTGADSLRALDLTVSAGVLVAAQRLSDLSVQVQAEAEAARVAAAARAAAEAAEAAARAAAEEAARAAAAELRRRIAVADAAPNGEIPEDVLCTVAIAADALLRCDAAEAFDRLAAAYRADVGRDLDVVSSYRSFAAQVAVKAARGGLAAAPGRSNHGRGIAVDLGGFGGIGQFDAPAYLWMKEHAAEFGWHHPAAMEPGGSAPQEPWHWEYGTAEDPTPESPQR